MPDSGSPSFHGLSAAQREQVLRLLILRHLYDGDVIEWPISEDHPHRAVFQELESQGWVARWDRTWPLRDRYRLTEKGIALIEQNYKPGDSERLYREMQSAHLPPRERRERLEERGYDPVVWGPVHDPYLHWSTWDEDPGPYHRYIWEEPPSTPSERTGAAAPAAGEVPPNVVDLDQEAGRVTQFERDPTAPVSDLS